MEAVSLIDFLKLEINHFRELLSAFVAEELAYKELAHERLLSIATHQQQILEELKTKRPSSFKPFNLNNEVDSSLLNNLKEQLETLVSKVNSQYERNCYLKNLKGIRQEPLQPAKKPLVETLEEEC